MRSRRHLTRERPLRFLVLGLATGSLLAFTGCTRLTGPEDPEPLSPPALVSVTVEYRQPNGCLTAPASNCEDKVVFFGSWMPVGAEFFLTRDSRNQVWRGLAEGVPVNFPPRDEPYLVRVYDPFLRTSPTEGITANRLTVGGEFLNQFTNVGDEDESALVYIDSEGRGHNAF